MSSIPKDMNHPKHLGLKKLIQNRLNLGFDKFHDEDDEGHESEGAIDKDREGKGTDEGHEGNEGYKVEV